jgi:hypothetical protein
MTIKKISVFCGAHLGKSPDYKIAAQQIGKMMAGKLQKDSWNLREP